MSTDVDTVMFTILISIGSIFILLLISVIVLLIYRLKVMKAKKIVAVSDQIAIKKREDEFSSQISL